MHVCVCTYSFVSLHVGGGRLYSEADAGDLHGDQWRWCGGGEEGGRDEKEG